MDSLEEVRRAALSAGQIKIKDVNERSVQIVTSLFMAAFSSRQFSSQQDIVYLLKTLLEESIKVRLLMDKSIQSTSNDLNSALLISEVYSRTGVSTLEEIGKYFSCFNIIKSTEFSEIVPEAENLLKELITEHSDGPEAPEQIIQAKLMDVSARLIPYLTSNLDEYVNVKAQVMNAFETISAGVNIVVKGTGGREMGKVWVVACIDSTVDLYINTLKQVLSASEAKVLNMVLLAEVKKKFAVNIGNLVLSIKYMSPLIEQGK